MSFLDIISYLNEKEKDYNLRVRGYVANRISCFLMLSPKLKRIHTDRNKFLNEECHFNIQDIEFDDELANFLFHQLKIKMKNQFEILISIAFSDPVSYYYTHVYRSFDPEEVKNQRIIYHYEES